MNHRTRQEASKCEHVVGTVSRSPSSLKSQDSLQKILADLKVCFDYFLRNRKRDIKCLGINWNVSKSTEFPMKYFVNETEKNIKLSFFISSASNMSTILS